MAWDHEVDLLIVGSGAGAMVAAIVAHDHGMSTLLVEKTEQYGGNSAMSGGAMWVPCNAKMLEAGVEDSRDNALTYLRTVTRGMVPDEKIVTYIDSCNDMLDYLLGKTHLRAEPMFTYPDYFADEAGGTTGGRSLEPEHFDARRLGGDFYDMREPAVQELVLGRMSMTATEAHHILARHPGWVKMTASMMARYWGDLGGRIRSKRDRCLSLGNALVAPLRLSMIDRAIPLWLETPMEELVVEDGRVTGITATRNGKPIRIAGRKGVVLAAGGFERNQEMRSEYLPDPSKAEWTTGSPGNTGDAIQKGAALGAKLDLMEHAWWGPTTVVPGEWNARMLVVEKGLPGSIMVNKRGERFVNEASPYNNIVSVMYEKHSEQSPCVPAYFVFDKTYRKKYPCGPFLPAAQQPDWTIPATLRDGYLFKSDTLEGLAGQIDVDAAGLVATVKRFNENASRGVDPDFKRGEGLFDKFYGDERVQPNPCLAPVETPPFYGLLAHAGELGTKGGVVTDTKGRVVGEDGNVIAGLFAIGNSSASVMGPTYPGAGATIAPAMTFGYIVARHLAGAGDG